MRFQGQTKELLNLVIEIHLHLEKRRKELLNLAMEKGMPNPLTDEKSSKNPLHLKTGPMEGIPNVSNYILFVRAKRLFELYIENYFWLDLNNNKIILLKQFKSAEGEI